MEVKGYVENDEEIWKEDTNHRIEKSRKSQVRRQDAILRVLFGGKGVPFP